MKKVFSVLLVLCMAFCAASAFADDPSGEVTINLRLAMKDGATGMFTEGMEGGEAVSAAIEKIINNLGLSVVSDGSDAEAVIMIGEKAAVQFAVRKDDNGVIIYSDLFPSFAVRVDNDSASAVGIPEIKVDEEALEKEVNDSFQELFDKITGKISEPASINEMFFDTLFTASRTVDISSVELATLLHDTFLDLLQKEQMSSLIEQLSKTGVSISMEDIDKALEEFKTSDDIPEINIEVFENDAKDLLIQITSPKSVSTSSSVSSGIAGILSVGTGESFSSSSGETTESSSTGHSESQSTGIAGVLSVGTGASASSSYGETIGAEAASNGKSEGVSTGIGNVLSVGIGSSSGSSSSSVDEILMQLGTISDHPVMHIESNEAQMDLKMTEDTIDAVLTSAFQGTPASVNLTVKKTETGSEAVFTLSVNGQELLAGLCDVREGAVLTGSLTGGDKKTVSISDIMNPESEDYIAFMTDLQTGSMSLLSVLFEAVPEAASLFGAQQ